MKKLNRKGFTLIELLAIIIILAVIMLVAVPPILTALDDSKKSSLLSSAKSVARGWSDSIAAAQLDPPDPTDEAIQSTLYVTGFKNWTCLNADHMKALNIDPNQYLIGTATGSLTAPTCSQAKVTGTSVEVILVVDSTHQMYLDSAAVEYTSGGKKYMWARSDGSHSWPN